MKVKLPDTKNYNNKPVIMGWRTSEEQEPINDLDMGL
jgi:hypothetical protein